MIRLLLVVLGVLQASGTVFADRPEQVSLRWSELASLIAGEKVALVLPDGTSVQGKVRGVVSDGLLLDISRTSDKKVHPKGLHTIPRASVSLLQVTQYGRTFRAALTAGTIAAAGGLLAYGFQSSQVTEGSLIVIIPALGAAGTVGLGIGGYYLGKAIDKRVTYIRVVPGD